MIFVDTNYFLRFLLKDIDKQYQQAKELFKKGATGIIELNTSLVVFFEIYWVLSSFYKKRKVELVPILANILKMNFIKITEADLLKKAVDLFADNNLNLEDSFNLVFAENKKITDFKTFDKKLSKKFKQLKAQISA